TTRSPIRIEPDVTASSPATIRSAVVLPQPEGPTKIMNSPSLTVRFISSTASVPLGKRLLTASNSIEAIARASSGLRVSSDDVLAAGRRLRRSRGDPALLGGVARRSVARGRARARRGARDAGGGAPPDRDAGPHARPARRPDRLWWQGGRLALGACRSPRAAPVCARTARSRAALRRRRHGRRARAAKSRGAAR